MPTPPEFQAVVMAAGKGSRMTEITSGVPKCLLPVANKPILWYPLQMLEREGFEEAIVIVSDTDHHEVQAAVDLCGLSLSLDIVAIPPGHEDWGTADSLRYIHDKIHADVMVVSGDLITSAPLYPVLGLFRKNQASIATLFLRPVPFLTESQPTPGPKTKEKPERDLVGISSDTDRLVLLASMSDFEEEISFGRNILRRHPHMKLHSKLLDSHIYLISKWVCDYLSKNESFSTLKGEFLPYVVRKQMSSSQKTAENDKKLPADSGAKIDIAVFAAQNSDSDLVMNLSSFNDHWGDMKAAYQNDRIRCYAHIADDSEFGIRVNTLQAYAASNREVRVRWQQIVKDKPLEAVHPTADNKSTQVDETSLIGEGAQLAEKTSVRGSAIGRNSSVQPRTRIANSVLMSNVRVGEGCSITNCVLCDSAVIQDKTELKDCVVGPKHTVAAGKHVQEVLADESLLMEI